MKKIKNPKKFIYLENKNFRHYCDVDYERTSNNCNCDCICRCSILENAHLTRLPCPYDLI